METNLEDLVEKISQIRPDVCDLIVITGGEPFRQNIKPLILSLLEQKLRVQIETNGTLWVDLPDNERLTIVCSPKTAHLHADLVPRISAYKYVLTISKATLMTVCQLLNSKNRGVA